MHNMSDNVKNWEGHPYINLEEGLGRLRGNKKIYKTLMGTFLKNDSMTTLQNALDNGDMDAAAAAAHTIKGMAGNLSFTALYQCSMAQEAVIKSGGAADISALTMVWDETLNEVNALIPTLV